MTAVLVEAAPRVSLVKRPPSAWDVYYAHSRRCRECCKRLYNCPAGALLWEAYREARGPILDPMPGRR